MWPRRHRHGHRPGADRRRPSLPQWVPEEYLLQLEKEAFLSLLRNDKTQARIVAMLESGKPLRN